MIKLSQIEKTYATPAGPLRALKGIDLNIKKGEIYGIIGLSGAGKSTLVRCINMLERPTKGKVFVDGRELTAMSDSELRSVRKDIGMIFQHFNLLSSATVYDNIAFPLRLAGKGEDAIRAKVIPLLKLVGLEAKAEQYPSQLSGGQKQRVGIARALASEPKVLLCDEATSALDPQTTRSILDLIKSINERLHLTVVVITHEMQVIKDICDKVAVLDGGVITEQGTVLEVFTNPRKDITKEFISVLLSNELPVAFRGGLVEKEYSEGAYLLLRLTFIGESADEPVLAGMIRKFPEVECTMLFGQLDQISGQPFGRMIVGLTGPQQQIDMALGYLAAQELREELLLGKALGETVYMVAVSMAIATLLGVPLGVLLHTTAKGQILEATALNKAVGAVVNAIRSIPFIILMVAIIPLTRLLVGSAIGTTAAMVPLVIASVPFIGRQVETSLKEVPYGLIEAAQAMGASPAQIIFRVLLPESMPGIVAQLTTVIISLVGESAMAGAIGGGGLGDLAIRYGYQRFRPEVMLATVIILIILVQLVQLAGNTLARKLDKR